MLQCCFEEGCVHPVCKEGQLQNQTWYPGGPSLDFIPLPVQDSNRPFNGSCCSECGTKCSGHYMKYDEALVHFSEQGKTDFPQPPSVVILETYDKYKSIPPQTILLETAQATLLPEEEVLMWFQHLHQIAENRWEGAKKADSTRKLVSGQFVVPLFKRAFLDMARNWGEMLGSPSYHSICVI